MRVGLVLGAFALVLVAVVVLASTAVDVVGQNVRAQEYQSEEVTNVSCNAAVGPSQPANQKDGKSAAAALSGDQKSIVKDIISIGRKRKLPSRAWQVAIQAGSAESNLANLDYGDRDSVGIFQMRTSMGWGTPAQLQDVDYQINKFYDVLEDTSGWERMRPGEAAQAVERSGFPERYHLFEALAVHLVENVGEVADAAGCGSGDGVSLPANKRAAKSIKFALKERGKPYVWGATGPDSYDCSGLMLRAYESANVSLPRTSREQYNAGAKLSIKKAKPGDLVFWAYDESDPTTIHHVAMYLGDNKIVEAQQSGVPVHTRPIKFDEAELLPVAVRPGV